MLPSKVRENMKDDNNDSLFLLDSPVVVLEGALGIHLECHQIHMLFSVSVAVPNSPSHMVLFFLGVPCLQLRAEPGL
jgi:hypothetical protein